MKMAANKQAQILQLTPASEIILEGPFNEVVTSYLELKNPSDQRVCFKVKTTAPKRYCVRPNSGIVDPGSKVKIAIMLQPFEHESQSERSKHKFMVQSTVIRDESSNLESVWQSATQEEIMDSKLRCVFQMPTSSVITEDITTASKKGNTPLATSPQTSISPEEHARRVAEVRAQTLAQDAVEQAELQALRQEEIDWNMKLARHMAKHQDDLLAAKRRAPESTSPLRHTGANTSKVGGDKSLTSSHNLTSSFLQPMSDDYKLVLVSLAMLFIGVILGKYII